MKTQLVNLKGGARLLFNKQTEINGISVVFTFNAGAINDPKGKLGVAHFCEHALAGFENAKMTREERNLSFNNFQYFNAVTSKYNIQFMIRTTDDKLEEAFDFVTEPFVSVNLNKQTFEIEQNIIRDEICTRVKSNMNKVSEVFNTKILKDKKSNNYICGPAGSLETFNRITIKDLRNHIKNYLTLNNLIITIVGNTSLKKVKKLVKKYVESRIGVSDVNGYLGFNPDINSPSYFYVKAEESEKALVEIDYYIEKLPFNYNVYREQFTSRFVNDIMNDLLFSFYRIKNKLTYGCSVFVGKVCDWISQEITIPCSEENLEKVINLFSEFIKSLPENLPKDLFEKSRRKFFSSYNFDFMSLDEFGSACYRKYFYENKLYNSKTRKITRKTYESITYEEANQLYKKLFSVKPHIIIVSNNEKFKDLKYKDFKL